MKVQELLDAVGIIEQVADNFNQMPEDEKNAVKASLHCRMASTYLIELAKHLQDGMEPYDAYLATARGEMPIP